MANDARRYTYEIIHIRSGATHVLYKKVSNNRFTFIKIMIKLYT